MDFNSNITSNLGFMGQSHKQAFPCPYHKRLTLPRPCCQNNEVNLIKHEMEMYILMFVAYIFLPDKIIILCHMHVYNTHNLDMFPLSATIECDSFGYTSLVLTRIISFQQVTYSPAVHHRQKWKVSKN